MQRPGIAKKGRHSGSLLVLRGFAEDLAQNDSKCPTSTADDPFRSCCKRQSYHLGACACAVKQQPPNTGSCWLRCFVRPGVLEICYVHRPRYVCSRRHGSLAGTTQVTPSTCVRSSHCGVNWGDVNVCCLAQRCLCGLSGMQGSARVLSPAAQTAESSTAAAVGQGVGGLQWHAWGGRPPAS
jgi:hypothetical protein